LRNGSFAIAAWVIGLGATVGFFGVDGESVDVFDVGIAAETLSPEASAAGGEVSAVLFAADRFVSEVDADVAFVALAAAFSDFAADDDVDVEAFTVAGFADVVFAFFVAFAGSALAAVFFAVAFFAGAFSAFFAGALAAGAFAVFFAAVFFAGALAVVFAVALTVSFSLAAARLTGVSLADACLVAASVFFSAFLAALLPPANFLAAAVTFDTADFTPALDGALAVLDVFVPVVAVFGIALHLLVA
jgi:hypothetical protein